MRERHGLSLHTESHETSPTKPWGEEKETHWLAGWAAVKVRSSFQKPSPSATFSEPTNRSRRGFSFILAKLVDTVTPMAPSETRTTPRKELEQRRWPRFRLRHNILCACACFYERLCLVGGWDKDQRKFFVFSTSSVVQWLLVRLEAELFRIYISLYEFTWHLSFLRTHSKSLQR